MRLSTMPLLHQEVHRHFRPKIPIYQYMFHLPTLHYLLFHLLFHLFRQFQRIFLLKCHLCALVRGLPGCPRLRNFPVEYLH